MKAVRATFLLLLFLTSFGRCWAESYGLLDSTRWACCETRISTSAKFDCHDQDSERHIEHDQEPEPIPSSNCSVCNIVDTGFTSSAVHLDFTAPVFFAIIPDWHELYLRIQRIFARNNDAHDFSETWSLSQVIPTTSEIVTSTAVSVRGPNLV